MEYTLKRDLDYKLVFDVLADSNGLVQLKTVHDSWPEDHGKLPQGCLKAWNEVANQDGYLDWEAFSAGVERALKADRFRLRKRRPSSPTVAEQTLHSLQRRVGAVGPRPVTSEEMQKFLSLCERQALVQALARARKEVYNCQRSLHMLTSPAITVPARKTDSTRPIRRWSSISAAGSLAPVQGRESVLAEQECSVSEREEVTRGLELLERAEKWYRNRLKYLSLEERMMERMTPSKQTQVEELLAALESGCRSHDRVSHIRGINTHLSALVAAGQAEQTADQPSLNRLSPRRHPHSDATLQLHGKAPHRSHSMTPADHTHGRRSKVKRSLSLKEFAPSHDHRLAAAVPAIEDVNLSASYPFPSATNSTTLAGMW